jgi:hypothetical protein
MPQTRGRGQCVRANRARVKFLQWVDSGRLRRGNQACDYILSACIHDAAEMTAGIVAKRLVERLERSGFVTL